MDGVTVDYDAVRALDNVTVELRRGEFVSIIGPNGAGKTTLHKTIAGIIKPTAGAVYVDGRSVAEMSAKEAALHLAYSSTDIQRGFDITVGDLVLMGRYPRMGFMAGPRDKEVVDSVVRRLGIEHLVHSRLDEVSDGERRKALLCKLLAQETEVLLVDEPLAHLDLKAQVEILNVLRSEADKGKLVIATSHVIDLPARFSDQMIVMKAGKVIAVGAPRDVLNERVIE